MKTDEQRNGVTGGGAARDSAVGAPTALGPGSPSGSGPRATGTDTGTAGASGAHPAAGDAAMIGQVLDGRYRIVAKLGEGGMGEVYAAEHVHIEKRVAVKLLRHEILANPEAVSRFRQEARSASSIGHQNIIAIEDFGKLEDGRIYLCMELLDGKPLNELLDEPLAPDRVLNILIQTCHGLAAAHRKGIVHRDMKPENIFVTRAPSGAEVPKILDFGIAKVSGNDGDNSLTRTGTIFGTPFYMSPEQALGQRVDHRADIYAMGVIMYECFTGTIPFSGDSFMAILTKHITAEPAPPAQRAMESGRVLPPGVDGVIVRAMKKGQEERYPSMDDMIEDLVAAHRVVAGPGMSAYMEAHVPRASGGYAAMTPDGRASSALPVSTPVPSSTPVPGITPYPPGASVPVPPSASPSGSITADGRTPSQLFATSGSMLVEPSGRRGKVGLIAAIFAALVVAAGVVGFLVFSGHLPPGGDDGATPGNGGQVDQSGDPDGDGAGAGTVGDQDEDRGVVAGDGQGQDPGSGQEQVAGAGQEQVNGADDTGSGQPDDEQRDQQPGDATGGDVAMPTIVLLDSKPEASVFDNGTYIGKTAMNVQVNPGETKSLVLKRPGYHDVEVALDGGASKRVVELERKRRRDDRGTETAQGGKDPKDRDDGRKPGDQGKEPKDKVGELGLGLE